MPQSRPTPGSMPSSMSPLQSSSMPLQISGLMGASPRLQVTLILSGAHSFTPRRRHAPVRPLSQEPPTSKPSSTSPSQSLSTPSQISTEMGQPAGWPHAFRGNPSSIIPLQLSSLQFATSTAQCLAAVPSLLSASLGSVVLYGHMFATPSSMIPLQLSSWPLQASAGGTVEAMMPTMAALAAAESASDTRMAAMVPPAFAMLSLAAPVAVSVMT